MRNRERSRGAVTALGLALALVAGLAAVGTLPPRAEVQQPGDMGLPPDVAHTIRTDLSQRTGVPTASITFVRVEEVMWRDGCVGIYHPGVACTLALVPGWVAWAQAGALAYRYHAAVDAAGFAAGDIDPSAVASEPLPVGVVNGSGPGSTPAFSGPAPVPGSVGLIVTARQMFAVDLIEALGAAGCNVHSLAVIEGGAWRVHVNGAPASVNMAFPALLGETTPLFVRCR